MTRLVRRAMAVAVPPLSLFALIVFAWHAAVTIWKIDAFLLPGPLAVLQAARSQSGPLLHATLRTGAEAVCGFASSLIVGTAIAALFSQSAWIRRSGYPYAIFLQTVPIIAIAPLIVVWFGTGFPSVVLVSFVISLFPIVTNGTTGLTAIDADLLDFFRLHEASRGQTLLKLRLPHAVPYLVTGARISSGSAVIGAIVGEFFAGYGSTSFGLGYLILSKSQQSKTAELFATVAASTLLGLAIFAATNLAGATILARWGGRGDANGR